ncbi:MAG: sigma-70 family RNA polymerase sigma factor [Pseudomonadales bacterium]
MKDGTTPALVGVSDEALMVAYASGDANAFDTLYARHKGALFGYFTSQLEDSEAHDSFQTLWLNVIRHRKRYRPSAPFRHYLFSLAHNVLMDQHRKSMRSNVIESTGIDSLSSGAPNPEEAHEREQLRARLVELVRQLPSHQREVWLLRQQTDFSTADIASVTGATEEGVKSRLRYARDKLKAGMARYAERN